MTNTNLTDTRWENVANTGSALQNSPVNFTNGWVKNLSGLAGSDFSSATLSNFSAADLPACPAALPTDWQCLEQAPAGSLLYFLAGPGVNLSAGSALADDNWGTFTLPLQAGSLDNMNLSGATFDGISMFNYAIKNANLNNVGFNYAKLQYMDFTGSDLTGMTVNQTVLTGTDLPGTVDYDYNFVDGVALYVDPATTYDLTGAVLVNSSITLGDGAILNLDGVTLTNTDVLTEGAATVVAVMTAINSSVYDSTLDVTDVTITGSSLKNVTMNRYSSPNWLGDLEFVNTTLQNSYIANLVLSSVTATNTTLFQSLADMTVPGVLDTFVTVTNGSLTAYPNVQVSNLTCSNANLEMDTMDLLDASINGCSLTYNTNLSISSSTLTDISSIGSNNETNMVFDFVSFNGAVIDFGEAGVDPTGAALTVTNSEFGSGINVTFDSYPAGNQMAVYFKQNNFLPNVSFNGENGNWAQNNNGRQPGDTARVVFENNFFEQPMFNESMFSFANIGANHNVFDGNDFVVDGTSPVFMDRMDVVLFTNNTFYSPGSLSADYLFMPPFWQCGGNGSECPAVLDSADTYQTYQSWTVSFSQAKGGGCINPSESVLNGVSLMLSEGTIADTCDICSSEAVNNSNACVITAPPTAPAGRGDI
jgi:uncharacterized protein YjbI with pentapeptide repeats